VESDMSSRGLAACGSPLEQSLLTAMFQIWKFNEYDSWSDGAFSNDPLCLSFGIGKPPYIDVAIQVSFKSLGLRRVDFVISPLMTSLFLVEIDGIEHHSDRESFLLDRKKDRRALACGLRTLRFGGPEVFHAPHDVVREIESFAETLSKSEYDDQSRWIEFGRKSTQGAA
jgi:hypothetical protein